MNNTCWIVRGVTGSGRTTLANRIASAHDAIIVSDALPGTIPQGTDVVIDRAHLMLADVAASVVWAKRNKMRFKIMQVQTPGEDGSGRIQFLRRCAQQAPNASVGQIVAEMRHFEQDSRLKATIVDMDSTSVAQWLLLQRVDQTITELIDDLNMESGAEFLKGCTR